MGTYVEFVAGSTVSRSRTFLHSIVYVAIQLVCRLGPKSDVTELLTFMVNIMIATGV